MPALTSWGNHRGLPLRFNAFLRVLLLVLRALRGEKTREQGSGYRVGEASLTCIMHPVSFFFLLTLRGLRISQSFFPPRTGHKRPMQAKVLSPKILQ